MYKEVVNVLKKQRGNVDRLDVKDFEVNLRTRFLAEEEGLLLEQGNGVVLQVLESRQETGWRMLLLTRWSN